MREPRAATSPCTEQAMSPHTAELQAPPLRLAGQGEGLRGAQLFGGSGVMV